jgi:F-type H+-transporting ATPase subunit a
MHIKFNFSKILTLVLALVSWSAFSNTDSTATAGEKEFNPGEMLMHHIADDHDWHFATIGHTHLSLPLPCIVYSPKNGLQVFMSSNFKDEHHNPVTYNGLVMEHGKIHAEDGSHVYDFSITKNVASLILSVVLLIVLFVGIAKRYKNAPNAAPKGFWQSAVEPFILFVRDDIAKNNIGEKHYQRFTPYLLTLFFFIWFNNLMGLLPGSANLTGNIAVTLTLAILTFVITNVNGKSTYWGHIFAMPGVPKVMLLLLTPVEIIGVFMKPFSLMVRLFANITAGHIILLSFIALIFIFKTWVMGLAVGPFYIFLSLIELLVAFLQAFIFTMLTSMYIGSAVEEHHH